MKEQEGMWWSNDSTASYMTKLYEWFFGSSNEQQSDTNISRSSVPKIIMINVNVVNRINIDETKEYSEFID